MANKVFVSLAGGVGRHRGHKLCIAWMALLSVTCIPLLFGTLRIGAEETYPKAGEGSMTCGIHKRRCAYDQQNMWCSHGMLQTVHDWGKAKMDWRIALRRISNGWSKRNTKRKRSGSPRPPIRQKHTFLQNPRYLKVIARVQKIAG